MINMNQKNKKNRAQYLVWQQSSASKKRRRKTPIKEGWHLANSATEDIGGISLAPAYSLKQQRTIARRNRSKRGMGKPSKSVWGGM